MPGTNIIDGKKLKKLISSCDFLNEKEREEWANKTENLPKNAIQFVYKKFKDAKRKIENVYISIALQHDPTGGKIGRAHV